MMIQFKIVYSDNLNLSKKSLDVIFENSNAIMVFTDETRQVYSIESCINCLKYYDDIYKEDLKILKSLQNKKISYLII